MNHDIQPGWAKSSQISKPLVICAERSTYVQVSYTSCGNAPNPHQTALSVPAVLFTQARAQSKRGELAIFSYGGTRFEDR